MPVPVPALATVRAYVCSSKVAVTLAAWVTVTVAAPVPVQTPPLQPVKREPVAGVAVRVTRVP